MAESTRSKTATVNQSSFTKMYNWLRGTGGDEIEDSESYFKHLIKKLSSGRRRCKGCKGDGPKHVRCRHLSNKEDVWKILTAAVDRGYMDEKMKKGLYQNHFEEPHRYDAALSSSSAASTLTSSSNGSKSSGTITAGGACKIPETNKNKAGRPTVKTMRKKAQPSVRPKTNMRERQVKKVVTIQKSPKAPESGMNTATTQKEPNPTENGTVNRNPINISLGETREETVVNSPEIQGRQEILNTLSGNRVETDNRIGETMDKVNMDMESVKQITAALNNKIENSHKHLDHKMEATTAKILADMEKLTKALRENQLQGSRRQETSSPIEAYEDETPMRPQNKGGRPKLNYNYSTPDLGGENTFNHIDLASIDPIEQANRLNQFKVGNNDPMPRGININPRDSGNTKTSEGARNVEISEKALTAISNIRKYDNPDLQSLANHIRNFRNIIDVVLPDNQMSKKERESIMAKLFLVTCDGYVVSVIEGFPNTVKNQYSELISKMKEHFLKPESSDILFNRLTGITQGDMSILQLREKMVSTFKKMQAETDKKYHEKSAEEKEEDLNIQGDMFFRRMLRNDIYQELLRENIEPKLNLTVTACKKIEDRLNLVADRQRLSGELPQENLFLMDARNRNTPRGAFSNVRGLANVMGKPYPRPGKKTAAQKRREKMEEEGIYENEGNGNGNDRNYSNRANPSYSRNYGTRNYGMSRQNSLTSIREEEENIGNNFERKNSFKGNDKRNMNPPYMENNNYNNINQNEKRNYGNNMGMNSYGRGRQGNNFNKRIFGGNNQGQRGNNINTNRNNFTGNNRQNFNGKNYKFNVNGNTQNGNFNGQNGNFNQNGNDWEPNFSGNGNNYNRNYNNQNSGFNRNGNNYNSNFNQNGNGNNYNRNRNKQNQNFNSNRNNFNRNNNNRSFRGMNEGNNQNRNNFNENYNNQGFVANRNESNMNKDLDEIRTNQGQVTQNQNQNNIPNAGNGINNQTI